MGDCISRQAVLTYIEFILTHGMGKRKSFEFIKKYVERQPSITPKQNVGKWIYTKAVSTGEIIWSECSVCGEGEHGCAKRMKFCPNCGAKMRESGVDE